MKKLYHISIIISALAIIVAGTIFVYQNKKIPTTNIKQEQNNFNAEDNNIALIKKYYQNIAEQRLEDAFSIYNEGLTFDEFKDWNKHFVSANIFNINKNQDGSYKFRVSLKHDEYGDYLYENTFNVRGDKIESVSSYQIIEEVKSSKGLIASSVRSSDMSYISITKDNKEEIVDSCKNENSEPCVDYLSISFSPNSNYLIYTKSMVNIGVIYNILTKEKKEFKQAHLLDVINNENNLLVCACSDFGATYYGDIYTLPSLKKIYSIPEDKSSECKYDEKNNVVSFYMYTGYNTGKIEDASSILEYDLNTNKSKSYDFLVEDINNRRLLEASREGDINSTKESIKKGADINFVYEMKTPLILAVENNHLELVKVLISLGADVNKEANYGETAIITSKNSDILVELIKAGADVNKSYGYGVSVLMKFSELGKLDCVKELIKAGANVNFIANRSLSTALIEASTNGHYDIVKELIKAGADINKQDIFQKTARIYAIEKGHTDIVNLLDDYNAIQ